MAVTGLHVENMKALDDQYAQFDVVWTETSPGTVDSHHIIISTDTHWSADVPMPVNRFTFTNSPDGAVLDARPYGESLTVTVTGPGSSASVLVKVMTINGVQAILSQPHGLEASFTWDVLDRIEGSVGGSIPIAGGIYYIFNERTKKKIGDFFVNEIGGLDDADVRDSREVRPSRHGEDAYNALYGGRTITLTGEIRATNLNALRKIWMLHRWAFADLKEHYLIFTSGQQISEVMIKCRKSTAMSGREVQDKNYWKRDVLLTLRASEPWFVSRVEHQASHAPTETFTLGRSYTRTFDARYTEFLDSENDVVFDPFNQFVVYNNGNFETYPRIELMGPMSFPIIQNMDTGETMYLMMEIVDGQKVIVDTTKRTITDESGNNLFSALNPISDWITLTVGINNLSVSVRTFVEGSNALATIFWRDAWM